MNKLKKLNIEFFVFYFLGLICLFSIPAFIFAGIYYKSFSIASMAFFSGLAILIIRVPLKEIQGKIEYIEKKTSNKLSVIYPILDEYLHRNKPRKLYVSKNLFKKLPVLEKDHQNIYQWYNRYRGRLYNTEFIIDFNLTNLQFSTFRSEKTLKTFEDLLEI
jgi:hypothetical protein